MSMISLKINLRQFKHALIKTPSGKPCIVLPIEENNFFVGKDEKAIYVDIVGFDYTPKQPEDKSTHLLKQSFSKAIREAMTEEQRKALPIIGNAQCSPTERSEPEPQPAATDISATAIPDVF